MSDTNSNKEKTLLPPLMQQPLMLLWVMIVPQLILLLINTRSFWLIVKEIAPEKIHFAYSIFTIEILLLALASLMLGFYQSKKSTVPAVWSILFISAHIAYLWFTSAHLEEIIPSAIEPWILDRGSIMLYQFTFMMPGLFYGALRLACFETKLPSISDLGWSFLTTIFTPAFFYVSFLMSGNNFWKLPQILTLTIFIGLTVITFVALIRFTVLCYHAIRAQRPLSQFLFAVLICLAAPLGGLWINRSIPFPADFQSLGVYVLAITNGLILILPDRQRYDDRRFLLFARAAAYPFTLYFFLVFLPFLPLALPAIFVLGAGFLILAPLILFLLHTKRLTDDFIICKKDNGLQGAIILMLVGFLVLPGYFTAIAFKDKASLAAALRYVYTPDYRTDTTFKGSVASVKRTLINLKNTKQGIQLPYLSAFYNHIVFEGMTLPQQKIEYMYRFFTGTDIPQEKFAQRIGIFGPRQQNLWRSSPITQSPVDQHVDLISTDVKTTSKDGIQRSTVKLTMQNTGTNWNAEFARTITIPRGILVTGFRLKIGNEMVNGQLFEKRTAMWVYHMIRDRSRRDPGILSYKSPTQLDLNVFPFLENQKRIVEIDFQYPEKEIPVIMIGDQRILLTGSDGAGGFSTIPRKPYLHIIFDYSAGTDPTKYSEQMDMIKFKFHDTGKIKKIAANFETREFNTASLPPRRGTLDLNRTIKQEFFRIDPATAKDYFPIFIVVTSKANLTFEAKDMGYYCADFPESPYITISSSVDTFVAQSLCPAQMPPIIDVNNSTTLVPEYLQGQNLLLRNFKSIKNPADYERDLPQLVAESRKLGVLTPATSFIVVERSSQWKTLQLKEKQRLKTSAGLEFAEDDFQTPAPSLWLMILIFTFWFWLKSRNRLNF